MQTFCVFGSFDVWILGVLDFWILGSFGFPVLLFDRKAASANEPKSDQQESRFRTGFYSVVKGTACYTGGDHLCVYIYTDIHMYRYIISFKYARTLLAWVILPQSLGNYTSESPSTHISDA